ncbi:MAG: MATE family efflux transporter [Candidatus Brocadiaceae bacterium]|nr:MATE family efflux transporter [Candidatus Brocadiaceae bacterium]
MHLLELTEKNLNRNIVRLCVPVAIENILHLGVFLSDTVMVGRLGTNAIAAAGLAGTLFFIISMIFSSFSFGASSIVARYIGAREIHHAQLIASQAILMSILLGILVTPPLFFFAEEIQLLMRATPVVAEQGKGYLQAISVSLLFRLTILTSSGILRGAGDTRTPMKITFIINGINILLNWLLIFGIGPFPKLGVLGVGCATAIAYTVGAGLFFSNLFAGKGILHVRIQDVMRIHGALIMRIARISLPATIDATLTQLSFLFFTLIVAMLGTVSLAAHQIAIRIESMSFMLGIALAVSSATLVGQSLGAKNADLALISMKRTSYFALSLMGTFAIIFLVLPEQMAGMFKPEPEVLLLAALCIMISAIEQPALAIYMVYSGGLRGAGDTLSPMIITIAGTLCLHAPMAYIFGITLDWGLAGVWLGGAIDWIFRAAAIYILYRRGRWKRIEV